jgi:soluble P-type ATPase
MIRLDIPGRGVFEFRNIVLDLNGTLSVDGKIHPKARDKISLLAKRVKIYVLTADTRGEAAQILGSLTAEVVLLSSDNTSREKAKFIRTIGPGQTVAIGNGYNDHLMVREAALGVCIIDREGASAETVKNSDVVLRDVVDALDFLLRPLRNRATLRR